MSPVRSKSQLRLMAAVANNPKFSEKVKIPQSVGKEFIDATPKHSYKKLKERLKKK